MAVTFCSYAAAASAWARNAVTGALPVGATTWYATRTRESNTETATTRNLCMAILSPFSNHTEADSSLNKHGALCVIRLLLDGDAAVWCCGAARNEEVNEAVIFAEGTV